MLQFLETGKALYVLAAVCALGVLSRWLARNLYKRLIRETDNITLTKNKNLRSFKQRAESTYRMNQGVPHVQSYLERQMYDFKFLGVPFQGYAGFSSQMTILCFLLGGAAAFGAYWYRCDPYYIVLYGSVGILAGLLTILVDHGAGLSDKKQQLFVSLENYLENNLFSRLERERIQDEVEYREARETARNGVRDRSRIALAGAGERPTVSDRVFGTDRGGGAERGNVAERGIGTERGNVAERGIGTERGMAADLGIGTDRGLAADLGIGTERGNVAERGIGTERGNVADRGIGTDRGLAAERGIGTERGNVADRGFGTERGLAADRGNGVELGIGSDRGHGAERGLAADCSAVSLDGGETASGLTAELSRTLDQAELLDHAGPSARRKTARERRAGASERSKERKATAVIRELTPDASSEGGSAAGRRGAADGKLSDMPRSAQGAQIRNLVEAPFADELDGTGQTDELEARLSVGSQAAADQAGAQRDGGGRDIEYLKRSLEQIAASREKPREPAGEKDWLKDLEPDEVRLIGDILKQYLS